MAEEGWRRLPGSEDEEGAGGSLTDETGLPVLGFEEEAKNRSRQGWMEVGWERGRAGGGEEGPATMEEEERERIQSAAASGEPPVAASAWAARSSEKPIPRSSSMAPCCSSARASAIDDARK